MPSIQAHPLPPEERPQRPLDDNCYARAPSPLYPRAARSTCAIQSVLSAASSLLCWDVRHLRSHVRSCAGMQQAPDAAHDNLRPVDISHYIARAKWRGAGRDNRARRWRTPWTRRLLKQALRVTRGSAGGPLSRRRRGASEEELWASWVTRAGRLMHEVRPPLPYPSTAPRGALRSGPMRCTILTASGQG